MLILPALLRRLMLLGTCFISLEIESPVTFHSVRDHPSHFSSRFLFLMHHIVSCVLLE